ncbi:DUF4123 domain-containing protein [Buttiauxella massiliensis]|uniref:DUF4123 domain-containing protein n=1 Tax=Buttiauxella massiliensis TaxID=2831590 RepID=UPI00125EA0A5|nr:DUF4123 domain-containing protein [Buttiauxella massiliensis]
MSSLSFSHAVQSLIHTTEVTLFALVDGLQYERFTGEELVFKREEVLPLFNTWPDSRIAFAGPWIIGINEAMGIREKLCELEATLPSVSWILSSATPADLVEHFQKNINIGLPDGRAALLRIQDPRVQVRLGAMLDSLQHQKLTHLTREWVTTIDGKAWSLKQREFIC